MTENGLNEAAARLTGQAMMLPESRVIKLPTGRVSKLTERRTRKLPTGRASKLPERRTGKLPAGRTIKLLAGCLMLIWCCMLLTPLGAAAEKKVTLTFTGDCTIGSDSSTYGQTTSFVTAAYEKGFDYFFANFKELFAEDDCTIINFEGVLSDYASNENTKKTYRFRGPKEFVNILKTVSIEAACLANNHTGDFGAPGLQRTKDTLTENGIAWFRVRDSYTFEKDGIRIRFYAMDTQSMHSEYTWLKNEISRVKAEKEADAVVAVFHGGTEYDAKRNDSQMKFANECIEKGADLVIMHHPHVVQGFDIIHQRTVCYSLGNFVFGGNNMIRVEPYRNGTVTSLYALVVRAELRFEDDGTYKGQQISLYPVFISGSDPQNDYQPKLVSGDEAKAVLAAAQFDTPFELPAFQEKIGKAVMRYLPAEK